MGGDGREGKGKVRVGSGREGRGGEFGDWYSVQDGLAGMGVILELGKTWGVWEKIKLSLTTVAG